MRNRIALSLSKESRERFNKIPEGSRSAVVRKLLEAYFIAYDKAPRIFDAVLRGEIIVEEANGND